MSTLCTSCGEQILFLDVYKCRQCVAHFVCELCKRKKHNQESAEFHSLEKILVSNTPLRKAAATTHTHTEQKMKESQKQAKVSESKEM